MPKEKIILKDMLFNKESVKFITDNISAVYPSFQSQSFMDSTLGKFPDLELKDRILHIRDMLTKHLPDDFEKSTKILIQSLPKALDSEKTDDDFGYFVLSAYGEFIAEHGCNDVYFKYSLSLFDIFTKRFSMEFAIRPFLKQYPKETLTFAKKWAVDENYHVRRFASEGIRPNLPWGGKVDIGIQNTLDILNILHTDHTQYVLRSVANNLNDITKIDADAVILQLKTWQKQKKQTDANIKFLIQHALRSELKLGNPEALTLLGYGNAPVKITELSLSSTTVRLGESLDFSFMLNSETSQKLLINYHIHFLMANGKHAHKVFHISKKEIQGGDAVHISKKHPLREMTTKKLYPGTHYLEIVVNGKVFPKTNFNLDI